MRILSNPLSVLLLAGPLFAADPFAGTWNLNLSKSKYGGPDKAPKEATVVIQVQGDHLAVTVKGAAADGSPMSVKYSVRETGGEETFSEGGPKMTGVVFVLAKRKPDAHSVDVTINRDGIVVERNHFVVGGDGKTMRQSVKGNDPQGKPYEEVTEYDKM